MPIRVLIFHGYLLGGTGSNVYNASLAAAMRRMGHDVHLVCEDRGADRLDFVDAVGDWDSGELRLRETGIPPADGSVTVQFGVLNGAGAHAPNEYYVVESTNPKVAGITDAVMGYVDMLHQIAQVR